MTPFDDDIAIARLEARLGKLVRHFETLAPGMADLPLYNDKVGVEAVDFMPFGDMGLGGLVTPWFISLAFLPLEPVPYDANRMGQSALVELPAGQRKFFLGGDVATGMFWTHSILSPLPETTSHEGAVAVARSELAAVLTQPADDASPETAAPAAVKSRREIILGTSSATATPR